MLRGRVPGSLWRGHVYRDRGDARTIEPLRVARGADDICPLGGEQVDGRVADPGGGPGDDDDTAGEIEVHALFSLTGCSSPHTIPSSTLLLRRQSRAGLSGAVAHRGAEYF